MINAFDITNDARHTYVLGENERGVFWMFNRSGTITFELAAPRAQAHIFSFFIGKNGAQETLTVIQRHHSPETTSRMMAKNVLFDTSAFTYEGLVSIVQAAQHSDAAQECRSLIVSPLARAMTKPALEILADDVRCRHAATTSPLDSDALFFLRSRGLSDAQATPLLIQGFFNETLEKIQRLGGDTQSLEHALSASLAANP